MTDHLHGSPVDPAIIENFGAELSATLRRQNWTDLRQVILGAEVGGVQRVKVPEAQRKAPYEIFYSELDGSGYSTAINASSSTPELWGLRVWIGHPPNDKDRWYVYQRVVTNEINPATAEPGTLSHATQHTLRNVAFDGASSAGYVGQDPIFIDDRQLSAVTIIPDSGLTVRVTPGWIQFDQVRTWFSGSIQDLTASVPADAGKALYLLVEIGSDGTVYATAGSTYNYALPDALLSTYVPAGTQGRYQVGAVCLRNAMTQVTWASIWTNMGLRRAGTSTLDQVTDVAITSVADNEVLAYDSASEDWINQTAAEAALATASHTHSTAIATVSTADVTNPPTDAELDSAFGEPATVGAGFVGLLDDAGAGANVYLCASDGTNWWYTAMTKAT